MSDDLYKDRLRQRRGTAHHIRVREFRRSAGAQRVYLCRYGKNILSLGLGWAGGRRRPPGRPRNLGPLIAVPHKNDLGLGRRIALAFVDQELSDEYDTV